MNQLITVSLSYKRRPFDAMDGMSSDASYNILPEFNGVTAVYSNRKTNIDIFQELIQYKLEQRQH